MSKITRLLSAALILVLALSLAACGSTGDKGKEGKEGKEGNGSADGTGLHLTPEEYPRVDGSTATIPLSEQFAAEVMDMELEEASQYIQHNKTHEAYVNLINKDADIIFVTSPSEEELSLAEEKGVALEVIPVASEGFVFLVNENNPIDGLTLQEIKGIYTGEITNWSQVSGPDKEIIPYQRPENSGSQTGMLDLVLPREEIMDPPTEQVVAGMGDLIDSVAAYNNEEEAIGYSYYYYVTDMWGDDDIKLLKIDGVYPDKETISSGDYPLTTAYYAVLREDTPEDSNARKLLNWILSNEGQAAAEQAGYVRVQK